MQILPVIDLKAGLVVHAVAGHRAAYQPIRSPLVSDPLPATVARAFVHCGFREAYVADLDAIAGAEPDWDAYQKMAEPGLRLLIDAGIRSVPRAVQLADFSRRTGWMAGVVVGSEAIEDSSTVEAALHAAGADEAVFSLDLQHGRPLTGHPAWSAATPLAIAAEVIAIGYRRLIVLELRAVGTGSGPTTVDLCRQFRERFPAVELISGGGVRHDGDIDALCQAGCHRVLVASALHAGQVKTHSPSGRVGPYGAERAIG